MEPRKTVTGGCHVSENILYTQVFLWQCPACKSLAGKDRLTHLSSHPKCAFNFWSQTSSKMELEALPVRNCIKFCMHITDRTPPPERKHRKISGQERLNFDSTGSLATAGHMFMSTWKTIATYNGPSRKNMEKTWENGH